MTGTRRVNPLPVKLLIVSLVAALGVLAGVSCSSTGKVVRPTSTGKTIKSAADSGSVTGEKPVFQSSAEAAPGITEIEVYEGSGEFINREDHRTPRNGLRPEILKPPRSNS